MSFEYQFDIIKLEDYVSCILRNPFIVETKCEYIFSYFSSLTGIQKNYVLFFISNGFLYRKS